MAQAVQAGDGLAVRTIGLARGAQALLLGLGGALAEDGATIDQWRVLDAIARRDAMTMGELAETTQLANATLTRVVDALEDAASVFRHPDPADRRRVTVQLTEHGTERLVRMRAVVDAWEQAVMAALAPDDLHALARAADVLAARASAAGRDA